MQPVVEPLEPDDDWQREDWLLATGANDDCQSVDWQRELLEAQMDSLESIEAARDRAGQLIDAAEYMLDRTFEEWRGPSCAPKPSRRCTVAAPSLPSHLQPSWTRDRIRHPPRSQPRSATRRAPLAATCSACPRPSIRHPINCWLASLLAARLPRCSIGQRCVGALAESDQTRGVHHMRMEQVELPNNVLKSSCRDLWILREPARSTCPSASSRGAERR